jgi:hypothetical protein
MGLLLLVLVEWKSKGSQSGLGLMIILTTSTD